MKPLFCFFSLVFAVFITGPVRADVPSEGLVKLEYPWVENNDTSLPSCGSKSSDDFLADLNKIKKVGYNQSSMRLGSGPRSTGLIKEDRDTISAYWLFGDSGLFVSIHEEDGLSSVWASRAERNDGKIRCLDTYVSRAFFIGSTSRRKAIIYSQQCCKYCSKGYACGNTCISRRYTCHVGVGCACDL